MFYGFRGALLYHNPPLAGERPPVNGEQ